MKLSDFDYYLSKRLIAQYPANRRDASRMMVLDRQKGSIDNKSFKDLTSFLKKGDVVVLNNSRVIPARIYCRRETGGKAEIFILEKIKKDIYEVLARPSSRLLPGKRLFSRDGRLLAEIIGNGEIGKLVRLARSADIKRTLAKIGRVPLPPYIKREPEPLDKSRYQTVYAKKKGSTASPTAGLHFTKALLRGIKKMGVRISYVTLHVSYGTFAPIKAEEIERHTMHREYFELPKETIEEIRNAKKDRGRIVAIGTTVTRVLESNRDLILNKAPHTMKRGWTTLFIYPGYEFRLVNMLLTNFHLPKSTPLCLVSAFAGRDFISRAYNEAVRENYRFYSYGDCMLIK